MQCTLRRTRAIKSESRLSLHWSVVKQSNLLCQLHWSLVSQSKLLCECWLVVALESSLPRVQSPNTVRVLPTWHFPLLMAFHVANVAFSITATVLIPSGPASAFARCAEGQ